MAIDNPWDPPAPPDEGEPLMTLDPRIITGHVPGVLPCPSNPPPPIGWTYWHGPVSPAAVELAKSVEHGQPLGAFVQARIDGKLIGARKEWHDYQGMSGKHGCFVGTSLFRPLVPV